MEFKGFPKIARYSREIIVTEKIDGTNASVYIEAVDSDPLEIERGWLYVPTERGTFRMRFGSRTRWITPEDDNFGFAGWATENAVELTKLGPGHHFGEWWGRGIQRGYGLADRRFSLFNVRRWADLHLDVTEHELVGGRQLAPPCCHVVPTLYRGEHDSSAINRILRSLEYSGSLAAPGFTRPEGVVILHAASGALFKKTIENDDQPKGAS